ncbi:methylamine utilization protein [Photobacterium sp. SDRW27]|uniref:cytochrome-c peroxidase n=1 Tax=Photobacterium obscurum TaxID=2829490 RepID=UPI002244AC59|nr:cytochrome c peroxidase [Photobacterium obscurum]MCW8328783.1 methylamine utilization protein [Photobacterium obscurum]
MNTSMCVLLVVALTSVVSCRDNSGGDSASDAEGGAAAATSDGADAQDNAEPEPQPFEPEEPSPPEPRVDIDGLPMPNLDVSHDYEAYLDDQPRYYTSITSPFGNVRSQDNTPFSNPVRNDSANLGRVIFYDVRLSANNTTSCASCHIQQHGFTDPAQLSIGFDGGKTGRHSMGLTNATYYSPKSFFWDERAATLEEQVLMPIQDAVEMGMDLFALESKLAETSFYPELFTKAFGDEAITSQRISEAMAQFIRSMVSYQSTYDQAFSAGEWNEPDFAAVFTEQQMMGHQLFTTPPDRGGAGCAACHHTSAHTLDRSHVNGLDANTSDDPGAGGGFFKSPSLRNIAVGAPYMHDGRFETLMDVVEFYNSGVQPHPNLSPDLRVNRSLTGPPIRLNLTEEEKEALVAFMEALTDEDFLANPIFSDPFSE